MTAQPRLHVDGDADRIARLANANAVTFGHDVFIPPGNFAPGTPRGDALIRHELAHVAQAPSAPGTLFRDGPPVPHYPTKSEQEEIESILGRHTTAPQPAAPTAPGPTTPATPTTGPTIVDLGSQLSPDQIKEQAAELMAPFERTLATKFNTASPPTRRTVGDYETAFDISRRARQAIYEAFGAYIDTTDRFTLTRDDKATKDDREARHEVLVSLASDNSDVDTFISNILEGTCPDCADALAPLNDASKNAVEGIFIMHVHGDASLLRRVKIAHLNALGGKYDFSTRTYTLTPFGDDPFGNAVHELLHASAHPAFFAAFGDEKLPNEGFTEYFTRQVRGVGDRTGSYDDRYQKIVQLRDAMFSGFGADSPEESLRLAYFKGRLDLIGWRPNTKLEDLLVKRAAPQQPPWDEATAKVMETPRVSYGRAQLQPHGNVLGTGFYLHKQGDGTFSMRYARVFHDLDPYSRGRLLVQGQLEGSPTELGGDLGLGIEYQRPWMYLSGSVLGRGSVARSGPPDLRLGAGAEVELGVRMWHRVRVGADGMVMFQPSGSKSFDIGAGLRVSVELK